MTGSSRLVVTTKVNGLQVRASLLGINIEAIGKRSSVEGLSCDN
jgi:hypothetical protein